MIRSVLDAILDGAAAIGDGLLDIASFGDRSARRARRVSGLDDPRPGHVLDAEKIRGDWEVVMGDVADAIKAGTVTADDVQRLGDAYGEHGTARTAK